MCLEQDINRVNSFGTTSNLFYQLSLELQTKIKFINVIQELPFSSFLVRKQKFMEAVNEDEFYDEFKSYIEAIPTVRTTSGSGTVPSI